jgi:hypothetical protein
MLVESNYPTLTESQKAALSISTYQQMEENRQAAVRQSAAIMANGFQSAGQVIGTPQPIPQFSLVQIQQIPI